jgi:hypothetical protein
MASKDQCFKEALGKVESVSQKTLNVEYEKWWVKDLNKKIGWAPVPPGQVLPILFNSIAKTLALALGLRTDVRDPGAANPVQLRRPDLTIDVNGKQIVVDNKFTDKDGNIDPWRTGGQSGSDQRGDYNDINHQQGVEGSDLSLNKDICKCSADPQPAKVVDPSLQPVPYTAPFGALLLGSDGPIVVPKLPPIKMPQLPNLDDLFPDPEFAPAY